MPFEFYNPNWIEHARNLYGEKRSSLIQL